MCCECRSRSTAYFFSPFAVFRSSLCLLRSLQIGPIRISSQMRGKPITQMAAMMTYAQPSPTAVMIKSMTAEIWQRLVSVDARGGDIDKSHQFSQAPQVAILVPLHCVRSLLRPVVPVRPNSPRVFHIFTFSFSLLPETLRAIVGNGSIPAARIYTPGLPILGRSFPKADASVRPPPKPSQNPFAIFTYPDIVTLLAFNAIVSGILYSILTPLSSLFEQRYPHLSQTSIGLCFLAIGGGMIIGTAFTGKLLDRRYRATKDQYARQAGKDREVSGGANAPDEHDFPIEWARLQLTPVYMLVIIITLVGYGWSLRTNVNIAVPLILQVICE